MTFETESSGETAGNQALRQVSGPSRRPVRHFAWGGRANGNQLVPQAEANVVSQNLLVSTSRKEISWCNKARLRVASTSRARAKVWAWGLGLDLTGPQGLGLGRPGAWPGWSPPPPPIPLGRKGERKRVFTLSVKTIQHAPQDRRTLNPKPLNPKP